MISHDFESIGVALTGAVMEIDSPRSLGLIETGAVIGAQLGAKAGARLQGEQLRGLLALMVLGVCGKLLFDLLATPAEIYSIGVGH